MRFECPVFSGLGGRLFDGGTRTLEKMIDALPPEAGATHHGHKEWEKISDGIIARWKKFGPAAVCLVGHSYGALRCQQIATRLNSHGINVQYLAGIDPTALPYRHPPMVIPANVMRVDEFHASSGFPAGARRRDQSGKSGGRYIYPANWNGWLELHAVKGGHVACASNPAVQTAIVSAVAAVLDTID